MAKVLVTGGAGFIGLHLVARLVERGDEVIVLDNMKRGRRESVHELLNGGRGRLLEDDIRRFDALTAAVHGCAVVFHLAAQSNVMGAVTDPDYSITTNVLGTFNVLRSAAEAHVPRVVFTSSREVYGDPDTLPVAEDGPLLAKNPYGASKVAGEAYCRTFAATHGLHVDGVRFANVYGAGDSDRVIPLWLTAAQEGRDLVVYGGEQVIDFLWVGTAVEALLLAADRGLPGPVNIGVGLRPGSWPWPNKSFASPARRAESFERRPASSRSPSSSRTPGECDRSGSCPIRILSRTLRSLSPHTRPALPRTLRVDAPRRHLPALRRGRPDLQPRLPRLAHPLPVRSRADDEDQRPRRDQHARPRQAREGAHPSGVDLGGLRRPGGAPPAGGLLGPRELHRPPDL